MKRLVRMASTLIVVAASALVACAPSDAPGKAAAGPDSASGEAAPVVATPVAGEPIAATALPAASPPSARPAGAPGRRATPGDASVGTLRARSTMAPAARRRVFLADVDLTDVGYDRGSPDAPIVMINFSDFGCPYCGQFERETFPALEREFIATGKVYYKYVPFVMGMFPNGGEAARAAECAADAGAFWPMHDRLYAAQSEWKRSSSPAALFLRYASAGTDTARLAACYRAHQVHPRTARANKLVEEFGVRVTPSFVVNGRPIEGALPLSEFQRLLRDMPK